MLKKILLAVDDSIHSTHSIQYVVRMLPRSKDLTYTLFHVQPTISQFLMDEAKTEDNINAELKKIINEIAVNGQSILEKNKEEMIGIGVAGNCIDVITQPKMLGLAKDILEFAQKGLYDSIVVGRRGLSHLPEAFMGSISNKLIGHSGEIPVWVVDGDVTSPKIMVAVDGSESSLSAIDHLSFMVGGSPDVKFTLFHVTPSAEDYGLVFAEAHETGMNDLIEKSDQHHTEKFFAIAQQKFREAGIQDSQIKIKVSQRADKVGQMILDEAQKENYGTVVVGRRGINDAFFIGSVASYVAERITNRALWLVS